MRREYGLLLAVLWSCSTSPVARPPCVTNDECGAGNVCFAEGCGDPVRGLVIEVAGNGIGDQFTQDFAIDDGALGATQNLEFGEPLHVIGEFQRDRFYSDPVRLLAIGKSEVLPGVSRVFEARIDQPLRGTYQFDLGAGKYRVTALPADVSVPPVTITDVTVRAGFSPAVVNFAFPTVDQAITLSGRLLKKVDKTQTPAIEVPLTAEGTAMDLQAFDPVTGDPLSQRFPVSSGQAGSNGNFSITINPRARDLKSVLLTATPHSGTLPLPTKKFMVPTPLPTALTLELGDFGEPMSVSGRAVDPNGVPIANAAIVLEGSVGGGGTFRSKLETSDADGRFSVQTLPAATTFMLTVIPPPESGAAATMLPVGTPGGPLSPSLIACDPRVTLTGQVLTPEGAPAGNVAVRAIEQSTGSTRPLALNSSEVMTDAAGLFAIRLDPSTWRLEFSSGTLPMASRLVVVTPPQIVNGIKEMTQSLAAPIQLASARLVRGVVTGTNAKQVSAPIPFATLRFFKVSTDQVPTAILLGTAIADQNGQYTINLPR